MQIVNDAERSSDHPPPTWTDSPIYKPKLSLKNPANKKNTLNSNYSDKLKVCYKGWLIYDQ